jgi:hypothetical protein
VTVPERYLVDSDVFITAKNVYYAFDICPCFWKSLIHHHGQGRVFSIDRVRSELLAGRKTEDLVEWVRKELPGSFFLEVDTDAVTAVYTEIMVWVQRHPDYFDYAKAKFATGADGWLVAYANVHDAIVITNEQPRPDSRKEIKLPDVCKQFGVKHDNTFSMLRSLGIRFDWEADGP